MPKPKKLSYIYASGRRKSASARVRLYKGKGVSTVNDQPIDKYFPGAIFKDIWSRPLKVVDATEKYYFSVKVIGGG
ncbi:30S ribosomal protein S9, partial [Candidatus Woesebacteria bacterium RIFCSPHIGHO2_01_FULL_37_10]